MKQITVFAVATFGGQIIDFQEPIKKKITMSDEQAVYFAKNGFKQLNQSAHKERLLT